MSDNNGLPSGKHTLVEEGTELTGKITSTVPIVVMGKIEGDISGPEIQVAANGVVAGNVKVQQLRSDGEVAGSVEAEAVRISGRVRDRTVIRARSLEVTLSGKGMEVQFGDCELQIGDAPDKEAAIAAATAVEPARTVEAPRRARPSETPWDEAAKAKAEAAKADVAVATAPAVDDDPKRKRGTQPPPVG
jgi:cytoskeletal protein CcmA (bactofilin family)